jgi:hypothetical protein
VDEFPEQDSWRPLTKPLQIAQKLEYLAPKHIKYSKAKIFTYFQPPGPPGLQNFIHGIVIIPGD